MRPQVGCLRGRVFELELPNRRKRAQCALVEEMGFRSLVRGQAQNV